MYLDPRDIQRLRNRFTLNKAKLTDVAVHMAQLVEDRFKTRGESGGRRWPDKRMKSWGHDDRRNPLTGRSRMLQNSFEPLATDKLAIVGSWSTYSHVHELGTVGKGGILPTIRPKKAKALFIPITDKAANSIRFVGSHAARVRVLHRLPEFTTPYRAGVRESRKNATVTFTKLKRGRLKDDKLEVWDEWRGEYKTGTPDFIFLQKVDIAPRPMLPTSPKEILSIVRFLMDRMFRR